MPALPRDSSEDFTVPSGFSGITQGANRFWFIGYDDRRFHKYTIPGVSDGTVTRSVWGRAAGVAFHNNNLITVHDGSPGEARGWALTGGTNLWRAGFESTNTRGRGVYFWEGHFYVIDEDQNKNPATTMYKYDVNWNFIAKYGMPQVPAGTGIVIHLGVVYVSSRGSNKLYTFTTVAEYIETLDLDSANTAANGMTIYNGTLRVLDATKVFAYVLPILKVSASEPILRFVTVSPTDKFGDTVSGELQGTYDTDGGNTTGLTKYNNMWVTCEFNEDGSGTPIGGSLKQYTLNFIHTETTTPTELNNPWGLTVFRTYLLVLDRDGTRSFIRFFTGGVFEFSAELQGVSYPGGIAADDTHLYVVKSSFSGVIYRFRITIGTNSATFTEAVSLSHPYGRLRGLSIIGDKLYAVNDHNRQLVEFNKANFNESDVMLTLDSQVGLPHGLYAEYLGTPQTIGISTSASTTPILHPPQKLGMSTTVNTTIDRYALKKVALPQGLRIVTVAPSIDKFGDTQFGDFERVYDSNGDNETGITKYNDQWFTCDNADDSIRRYNYDDFSYIGRVEPTEIVVPVGMTTFRGYLVVLNRRGSTFRVQFYQGIGVFRFQSAGLPGTDYRAIAADSDFIYLYNNGANRIERIPVTLTSSSATLGTPTNWSIADTAIRGMRVLGDSMYTINTRRQVREFDKSDGSGGDIVLTLDSRVGGPQGMYVEYVYKPLITGISTAVEVHIVRAVGKTPTQRLGISGDGSASKVRLLARAVTQRLSINGVGTEERAVILLKAAAQSMVIDPKAVRDKLVLKTAAAAQTLGIKPEGALGIRSFIVPVAQTLGIKTTRARDILRLRPKQATQTVGIAPGGTASSIMQQRIAAVVQGVIFGTSHDTAFSKVIQAAQKLSIAQIAPLIYLRPAPQSLGIGTGISRSIFSHIAARAVEKLGIVTSTDTMIILRITQSLGISKNAVKDRLILRRRRPRQSISVAAAATGEVGTRASATQGMILGAGAVTAFITLVKAMQGLRFGAAGRTEGMIHIAVRLGISAVPTKRFFATALETLGFAKTAAGYRVRIRARNAAQTLGISTTHLKLFQLKARQGLQISKTAASEQVRRLPKRISQTLGIKPGGTHHRIVPLSIPQTLGIRGVPKTVGSYVRHALIELRIHAAGAPNLPSVAPFFHLKDRIRRSFRV